MPFYDLTLEGTVTPRLSKRGVILRVVHAAVRAGAHPDELAPMFDLRERAWFWGEGWLTGADLRQHLPEGRRSRFFLEDEELLHLGGRTYALTNQWGDPSWSETIRKIGGAWSALGLEVSSRDGKGEILAAEELDEGLAEVAAADGSGVDSELPEIDSQLLAAAGEYYVLFQLHRRGLLAGLAPRGYRNVDVIVLGPEQQVAASIQVKTRRAGHHGGWRMGKKHETVPFPGLHFCLVDLEPARPATFVVPAEIAAGAVCDSHAAWLAMEGHNDNPMRTLSSDWGFSVPGYTPGWL